MHRSATVALVAALAAAGCWLLGALPWAVGGFELHGTSQFGDSASGVVGVRLPFPLVLSALPLLIAVTIVGSVVAGLVPVSVTRFARGLAVLEVWAVVLTVLAATVAVSVWRIRSVAAGEFAADGRVLAGLAAVTLACGVIGLLAATVAITWYGATSVTAALVAGLMPTWVGALLSEGALRPHDPARIVSDVLVAAILAAGLMVSVRRTRSAVLGWPVALAVLWSVGPAVTAVSYLTALLRPANGIPGSLPDHLAAARTVFGQAFGHEHPSIPAVIAGVVAGLVAAALHGLRAQRAHGPRGRADG